MDKILEGTLNSSHPEALKKLLVDRIILGASVSKDEAVARNIFGYCSTVITKANSSFDVSMARQVITVWSRSNSRIAAEFVLDDMDKNLNAPFSDERKKWLELVSLILPVIRNADNDFDESAILGTLLQCFLRETEIEIGSIISQILIQNWNGKITNGLENDLISKTIMMLKNVKLDNAPDHGNVHTINEKLPEVFQISLIIAFVSKLVEKEKQYLQVLLTKLSSVLLNDSSSSNIALAPLLHVIPSEMSEVTAEILVKDIRIKDETLKIVLNKLTDWFVWPGIKNLDIWIVNLLKHLLAGRKGQLVADFILKNIEKVFHFLEYPSSRQISLPVFMYMMTVYQHSPEALHQIAPKMPALMKMIKEEPASLTSNLALKSISELLYTLMFNFPGYPDIYSQLVDAIKDFKRPSQDDMKRWLSIGCCIEKDLSAISISDYNRLQRKSVQGKTGLVNLGNTCYMNSVVQALFMLKEFRASLLPLKLNPGGNPITAGLQELFAFLLFSERPSIRPEHFYKISRPVWFRQGAQQDCSEFLKYLFDKMEDETKGEDSQTQLHTFFTGECRVDVKCSNCQRISSRFEAFNDIPLSFPDNREQEKGPHTLKGGDISKTIANDRVSAAGCISSTDKKDVIASEEIIISQPQESDVANSNMEKREGQITVQRSNMPLDIQGLLDNYLSTEYLMEQNRYMCDWCHSLQDAEQRHYFTSCPRYLILTLKRFTYDMRTHTRSKILKDVHYPLNLIVPVTEKADKMSTDDIEMKDIAESSNITRTTSTGHVTMSMEECSSETNDAMLSEVLINLEKPDKPVMDTVNFQYKHYTLVAIIVHSGVSSESGHYYCYSKEKADTITSNQTHIPHSLSAHINSSEGDSHEGDITQKPSREETWYIFNDSNVSCVESSAIGELHTKFPRDTPYVFIYEEVNQDHASLVSIENIRLDIALAVRDDNEKYYKQQNWTSKHKSVDISDINKIYKRDKKDDDDKDNGPSSSCGGTFSGFGSDANRFIF